MADNVMALVKKKGPQKKLRGKAAQAAKRRAASAATATKRVPDKRNPFRPFADMDPSEMIEEIDSFVHTAGWTQDRQAPDYNLDREMVKLFSILKSGIPFPLVKTFFVDFDESDSFNVVRYFEEFKRRPDVRARIENMKEIIRRRQATPSKIDEDALRYGGISTGPAERQYTQVKILDRDGGERAVSPPTQQPSMLGPKEILSRCEREYRRAPWMFPFSDKVIRGFALKGDDDFQYTIPQEVKDGWYKVNMDWYRMACAGNREYVPGMVAYVTVNNDIIVETEDMYRASKQDWLREFTPLDPEGFKVAKRMLMNNEVLKSAYSGDALKEYAKAIITSFGPIETNYDLARKTSYVLVFLTSLIDDPQIYHEKIRSQEYPGNVLVNLDRYTLLPEVFMDPNIDKAPTENKIKRERRSLEKRYYDLIKQNDPAVKKHMRPRRMEAPVRDHSWFFFDDDSVSLQQAVLPPLPILPVVRERRVARELAPGLFQKLRERIGQMTPIYCNQCNVEVFAPPFTTPRGAERLKFCSKECFDRYDI